MSWVAPPVLPPGVSVHDDDRLGKVRFRLWQILMTAGTVVLTGWFCTLGIVPAIIALFAAKHILVAILVAGLRLPAKQAQ